MLNLLEVYSNRKGFTLVEIVLSIAILSIILSSIFSLLFFVNTIKIEVIILIQLYLMVDMLWSI